MASKEEAILNCPPEIRLWFDGAISEIELINSCFDWANAHNDPDKAVGIANRMHKIILAGGVPDERGYFAFAPPAQKKGPKPGVPVGKMRAIEKAYDFDRMKAETEFLKEFRDCVAPGDIERMYEVLFREATKGSHHHMKMLLEYLMGKPADTQQTQHVNVNKLVEQMTRGMADVAEADGEEFDFEIDDEIPVYGLIIDHDAGDSDSEVWQEAGLGDGAVSSSDMGS